MKLSEKIYTYRKRLGFSQEEFAEKLSVSRQAVSKWETGEASPELSKIPIMASIFGVTADHLLSDEEPRSEEPAEKPKFTSPPPNFTTSAPPQTPRQNSHKSDWIIGVVIAVIGAGILLFGCIALLVMSILTGRVIGFNTTVTGYDELHEIVISSEEIADGSIPYLVPAPKEE